MNQKKLRRGGDGSRIADPAVSLSTPKMTDELDRSRSTTYAAGGVQNNARMTRNARKSGANLGEIGREGNREMGEYCPIFIIDKEKVKFVAATMP